MDLLEQVAVSEREEIAAATNPVEASNIRTAPGARRQAMSHLLPLVVLVVFVAAALGAFLVTRKLVVDQEERLLRERAGEVAALLSNAVGSLESQRSNVEVVAAMHGSLGLELAHENRPSLILLDLHLPDIDGEQVLLRLREDPITASIPVVIVSADATPGQIQRLLAAGATSYITKPIDVRELLNVFDRTVGD